MPFVNVNTNTEISKEQAIALKAQFGKAIENLGKTESWLMVGFNGGIPLYFKGDDAPAAFVDISVFGSSTDAQCEKMTAAVCGIIEKELGIPADRTYVKYSGISQWGWNNMNF